MKKLSQPIKSLPEVDGTGVFDQYCTATGWGRVQLGSARSAVLLAITTRIVQNRKLKVTQTLSLLNLIKELKIRIRQAIMGLGILSQSATVHVCTVIFVLLVIITMVFVKEIVVDLCFVITNMGNLFYMA